MTKLKLISHTSPQGLSKVETLTFQAIDADGKQIPGKIVSLLCSQDLGIAANVIAEPGNIHSLEFVLPSERIVGGNGYGDPRDPLKPLAPSAEPMAAAGEGEHANPVTPPSS